MFDLDSRLLAYLLIGCGAFALVAILFAPLALIALLVIGPGLVFLHLAINESPTVYMAIPGMLVTGTGLILLFDFITNHWASWAYMWLLYPVFLGIAFRFIGEREDNDLQAVGQAFMNLGLVAFFIWAVICELLFFGSFGSLGSILVALSMIGLGYWLLRGDNALPRKRKPKRKGEEQAGIYF